MPHFVNIALPLPTQRLFTYAVPDEMAGEMLVGSRALVPFGKRTLTGVIVEKNVSPVEKTKPVLEILDSAPIFSSEMLALTKWIAEYYLASWGESLKAALPQGMSPESVVKIRPARDISYDEIENMAHRAPRRAELLRELLRHSGEISVAYLSKILDSANLSAIIESLEHNGLIEILRSVAPEITAKKQRAIAVHPDLLESNEMLREVLDSLDSNAPKQALLLSHAYIHRLHHTEPLLMATALQETKSTSSAVKALVQKKYLVEFETEVLRGEISNESSLIQRDESDLAFTIEQQHSIEKINEAIFEGKFKTFLLHGVTGSGKTLIYIEAISEVLRRGKTALLLVPEISLTPQLIARFRAFFGNEIAVFHSRMSAGERYDAWRSTRAGNSKIVIGARSAIFAPLKNIGIIIVDEEHEPSYKQDAPAPRYNARDCAIIRGNLEQAIVVLGSATPSMESMLNARNAKYHLLEITRRADGAKMPEIEVVNTVETRKRRLMTGSFSKVLLDKIFDRLQKKEGIILFHNRRGFAPRLECADCAEIPTCPNCSVSLTLHKYRGSLRCHYCGYTRSAEKSCRYCGHPELKEIGAGTQKIEDELNEILNQNGFDSAVIQRMDLDTTTKKGSHAQILKNFASGAVDILLGTQMVAKGLDFERVTLVGVVSADIQLFLPDFRAGERTFQLLTQVAGRAGRSSDKTGEVVIQTAHPKHPAVLATLAGSYDLFYNDELQIRKEAMYPPFVRFVVVAFSGKDEDTVQQQAHYFANILPKNHAAIVKLGPAVPSIAKIRSEFRRIIVVKSLKSADPQGRIFQHILLSALMVYGQKHGTSAVRITIDVDASGFL